MNDSTEIMVSAIVVDSRDPASLAAFWHQLLGGETVAFDEYGVVALRAPGVTFDFVAVPDDKTVKNRLHLDLATAQPQVAIARVTTIGGIVAADQPGGDRFTVMHDIEGNEFCILHSPIDSPWAPPAAEP